MAERELVYVKIAEIRENPVALRNVNQDSEEYKSMVDSIKSHGVLNAITVRRRVDGETQVTYYELTDGLQRFTASKDVGLETIPCQVVDFDDDQVLEAQVIANIHKIETAPMEYSKQLRRILTRNPMMSEAELATKLSKSTQWISDRLGLNKIMNEKISALVNEGKIKLANAYALAKLPAEEQAAFVDRAMTMSPDEFVPQANARIKELKDAHRKGLDAAPQEFKAVEFFQKIGSVKEELASGAVAEVLIAKTGVSTAAEGFNLAIQWILHIDPLSIAAQKAEDDARVKAREEQAKKKATERAAAAKIKADKAAADAATAAAEAQQVIDNLGK